jgi:hypothetical protein
MEWINQLIAFIQSSYVYNFLAWALGPAWHDAIGRTIILTAAAYFIAFSLFAGYFSRFARGFGGISVQQIGFHWSDVITLFPAGVSTIVSLFHEIKKYLIKLAVHIVAVGVIHIAGLIIALNYLRLFGELSANQAEILFQFIPGFYLVGLFGLALLLLWKRNFIWIAFSSLFLLATFTASVVLAGSVDPTMPLENPMVSQILEFFAGIAGEISLLIYGLVLALIPFTLGTRIAEETVKQGMLSRVAYLILQQPLTCLSGYEEQQMITAEPSVPWSRRWFTKPSFHVSLRPDVYGYCSTLEKPLYLVASFRENLALFEPAVVGDQFDGRLILINQSLVRAIELRSSKEPKRTTTKTIAPTSQ